MAKFFRDSGDNLGDMRKEVIKKEDSKQETKGQNVSVKSEIATFSKEPNKMNKSEDIKKLTNENAELKEKLEDFEIKNEALKKEIEKLKNENKNFESEIDSSKQIIDSLKKEITETKVGKIAEFDAREAELTKREESVLLKETAAESDFVLTKAKKAKEFEQEKANKMAELNTLMTEAMNKINAVQVEIENGSKKILEKSAELAKKETTLVLDVTDKWEEFLRKEEQTVQAKFIEMLENQKNNSLSQISDLSDREQKLNAREIAVIERETAVMKRENDANGGFIQKENELRVREAKVVAEEEKNENLKNALNEAVENRVALERDALNEELENIKERYMEEINSLNEQRKNDRDTITSLNKKIDDYEKIFLQYGSDSSSFEEIINAKDEKIKILQEAANSRTLDSKNRIDELNKQIEELKRDNSVLRQEKESHYADAEKISNLSLEVTSYENKCNNLEQEKVSLQAVIDSQKAKLEQISSLYERKSERAARIKDIDSYPVIDKTLLPSFYTKYENSAESETSWLEDMQSNFEKYQFKVHPRLLKSFHTSLKTADMSPLTVLAGVSGTGKSELPKLYSHFGGLNFMNSPVQPNWDSQEAMLGFFNTIDNKFDAKDVLRFIVQAQIEKSKDSTPDSLKNSLDDYVNLVLLDEMNLAHIELYFAEFLSRLEERRDRSDENVPTLPVNLGAGISPYGLKLSRNVLWVGTMNQDETTKTLSDKVLDRGIIINFPRPKELINITKRCSLEDNEFKRQGMLPLSVWNGWKKTKPLGPEVLKPYKELIEKMNDHLSEVGRSVGHRVWQSVVRYMENYPEVRLLIEQGKDGHELKEKLDIAFEDQLVQKIMPKLRGIETRGHSKTQCLDKIEILIGDFSKDHKMNVSKDYKTACNIGDGQFFWTGAEYLGSITKKDTADNN